MLSYVIYKDGSGDFTYGVPDLYVPWRYFVKGNIQDPRIGVQLYNTLQRNVIIGIVGEKIGTVYRDPKGYRKPIVNTVTERGKGYYAELS